MTFGLSPSYGIHNAREAHDWFLEMMREHEEFVVETDRAGEEAMPFWSERYSGWLLRDLMAVATSSDV